MIIVNQDGDAMYYTANIVSIKITGNIIKIIAVNSKDILHAFNIGEYIFKDRAKTVFMEIIESWVNGERTYNMPSDKKARELCKKCINNSDEYGCCIWDKRGENGECFVEKEEKKQK